MVLVFPTACGLAQCVELLAAPDLSLQQFDYKRRPFARAGDVINRSGNPRAVDTRKAKHFVVLIEQR
jgi:hypothetical protein